MPIAEPTRRLDPEARRLWRLEEALGWSLPVVACIAAAIVFRGELPAPLPVLLMVVPLLVAATSIAVLPELRWRRWRYEIREEEIDLLRGAIVVTRTLVPMQRVQHVDVRRDLLERALGFASVVFYTAAGSNSIPALRPAEAAEVRDRIAALTRTPDEL